MRCTFLLLALGCDGGAKDDASATGDTGTLMLPTCEMQPAGFAACLAGPEPASTKTPYEAEVYGSSAGEVVVVDAGAQLAAACGSGWGVAAYPQSLVSDPDVQWVQLEHGDGSLVTLGVKADGFDLTQLGVGTELSYDFASATFGWSPDIGHLELRDASGVLLLWLGEGGRLEDLAPPAELTIERGQTTCWTADECVGGWQQSGLVATVGGESEELAPYGTADLGGLHVVHGGFDEQTGSSTCPDAYVADLQVAVWSQ